MVKWDHLKGEAGVSDFWVKAIENSPMIQLGLSDKDKPALQAITHVKATKHFAPAPSITVDITFGPNEFFINDVLTFTCIMTPDEKRGVEVIGTDIIWKEDKDLTVKIKEIK